MRWWMTGLVLMLSAGASAEEAGEEGAEWEARWGAFARERRGQCVGKDGKLEAPVELAVGGKKYRLEGSRLVELGAKPKLLKVGIISATKDDREPTMAAVDGFLAWFDAAKVDLILANGDLASNEFEMEAIFRRLAKSGRLVLAMTGNTESCGSFNKLAAKTFLDHPGFINGNWVRRIELSGGTLLTVPGYYDRRFTHRGGAATYDQDDMAALAGMAAGAPGPVILTSHGPPKMSGKHGIDLATDAGHVGCQHMADFIESEKIAFGLFGHILEAGGTGSDRLGAAKLGPGAWHKSLFVNAGSANPDPWSMNDGSTSWGMAMIVEIDGARARYEVKRNKKPY